jgi:hypothetical protein
MKHLVTPLILLAIGGTANAESTQCIPIDSVPRTITERGYYCLTRELESDAGPGEAAITIQSDYVTLEFNGHTLTASAASSGASGVHARGYRSITVRGGIVRGFYNGVLLEDATLPPGFVPAGLSGNLVVTDMSVDESGGVGIFVGGDNLSIRRNRVRGAARAGILVNGEGPALVADNEVFDVVSVEAGWIARGIAASSTPASIERNFVSGIAGPAGSAAIVIGTGGIAVDNREFLAPLGVKCQPSVSSAKVRDNVVASGPGSGAAQSGCTLLGTNG